MSVPRTVSLCFGPQGSHADPPGESSVLPPPEQDESGRTPKGAPPGRLARSQRRQAAALQSDPPARVPITSVDSSGPSKSTFQSQSVIIWVKVPPGASPPA